MEEWNLKVIARIHTDFTAKFGIPRQSGLVESAGGRIEFEPTYRNPDAIRGLEEFSHIWVLWGFSRVQQDNWTATVAPPRLGGRVRKGVFATRSPYRPNPIGLSCLRLERIETEGAHGPILYVSGVDQLDGTPIYDIKPYLPYADVREGATGGFAERVADHGLQVRIPEELAVEIPESVRETVLELLRQDPRPGCAEAVDKEYRMLYGPVDIWFHVEDDTAVVHRVIKL